MPLARLFLLLALVLAAPARAEDEALLQVQRLVRAGDLPQALRLAAAADARNAPLRFQHGVILLDLQRDDEAMAVFQRLAEDFPELPDPLNNIALLHARAGRLDAARAALEAALRNDPSHRTARQNLGDIHLRLALQAWEAGAAAAPGDAALQRKLQAARDLLAAGR